MKKDNNLYIVMLSVHGLVRGYDMELGRDADTGGQVKYVVELAKALSHNKDVGQVDLITRKILSNKIDSSYQIEEELLNEKSKIVRIDFGPKRYLKKEKLWPYLHILVDKALLYFRKIGRTPDIIHGHYADAGYVGSHLARLLGVPFVFTGHSLGRVKKQRLLIKTKNLEVLDKKYSLPQRFEAEETALDTAAVVVASTRQEIEEQYKLYDHYVPKRMEVIPPGVDLQNFYPNDIPPSEVNYFQHLNRFLRDPEKPMILAIARPDEKKNFYTLVKAYGESSELRKIANLVIIAGNRQKLSKLEPAARKVLRNLMILIDEYDLYGSIAYPKEHESGDIADIYRISAKTKGVFVNPAFNEPFGLTLIEAAACGLPIVATNDGGPRDIIAFCKNGVLIDPYDEKKLAQKIHSVLANKENWEKLSSNGLKYVKERYSWEAHANSYMKRIKLEVNQETSEHSNMKKTGLKLTLIDRFLVTSISASLIEDKVALKELSNKLDEAGSNVGFCIVTRKKLDEALKIIRESGIAWPEVLVVNNGTEIYYGDNLIPDKAWKKHINYKWHRKEVHDVMQSLPEIYSKDLGQQSDFLVSYEIKDAKKLTKKEVVKHLRQKGLRAKVIFSHGKYIDILPIRAGSGLAIRHLFFKWGIPPHRFLVAGYSGGDEEMLIGNTLGVVVGNVLPELKHLKNKPRILFSKKDNAWGLLDGIEQYNFFGKIKVPEIE